MGNNSGKSQDNSAQYGGLYLKLDKPVYSPMETITGTININLIQPYPGSKLSLSVTGTERTRWVERQRRTRRVGNKTRTYYVNVTRRANISTIDQHIDIYTWDQSMDGNIPMGQWIFPFAFMIPKGLPGSFYVSRGSTYGCIYYQISASLVSTDKKISPISHGRELTIRENLYQSIQTKEMALTKQIKTWCCCNNGTLSLRTQFEKNAYAPSETAKIMTEVDNSTCSLPIGNLKFELVQHIRLQAQSRYRSLNPTIASVSLGKIQPHAPKEIKEAAIQLPAGQEGRLIDVDGDGVADYQEAPTGVSTINPSVNGYLIKSNFGLRLDCEMDGCLCCEQNPATELPIQIFSAALYKESEPVIPANWHPQQMPVANVTINVLQVPSEYQMVQYNDVAPNNEMTNYNMVNYNQMPQQNANFNENYYGQANQSQQQVSNFSGVEMVNHNQSNM